MRNGSRRSLRLLTCRCLHFNGGMLASASSSGRCRSLPELRAFPLKRRGTLIFAATNSGRGSSELGFSLLCIPFLPSQSCTCFLNHRRPREVIWHLCSLTLSFILLFPPCSFFRFPYSLRSG